MRTAVWLAGVLAALASRTRAGDGATVPGSQGAPTEREQRFIESLRSVTTTAQEDALAKQEIESARTIPRSAVSLWAKGDPEVSASALAFLSEIGDLAIVPMLEGPTRDDPTSAVKALNLMADAELGLRRAAVARVNRLLDDKRWMPTREEIGPKPEEPDHPRRVCDEAYVAMRKLVHFGESTYGSVVDASAFFATSVREREKAIARGRRTGNWRRAVKLTDGGENEDSPGLFGPPMR